MRRGTLVLSKNEDLPPRADLSVAAAGLRAQAPAALAPGRWPVGFTHLAAADTGRPLPSGRPRPLDIGIWYPAGASATSRLA